VFHLRRVGEGSRLLGQRRLGTKGMDRISALQRRYRFMQGIILQHVSAVLENIGYYSIRRSVPFAFRSKAAYGIWIVMISPPLVETPIVNLNAGGAASKAECAASVKTYRSVCFEIRQSKHQREGIADRWWKPRFRNSRFNGCNNPGR